MRRPISVMIRLGVLAGAAAGLSACATGGSQRGTPLAEPVLYEWYGAGMDGPAAITISLSKQRAEIMLGGQYAGWMTVATGKDGHSTPPGSYRITELIADKYSSHYGRLLDAEGNVVDEDADARKDFPPPGGRFDPAPMPYWMRLTNYGIGMHGGYIPHPGSPASKGCIRMPKEFAPVIFERVRVGTPVTIIR